MTRSKKDTAVASPLKVKAGTEVETLPDCFGQGTLVARFVNKNGKKEIHPLKDSYDDIIVEAVDENNPLCITTDSYRTNETSFFPKRTSLEFRSGPEAQMTTEVLNLLQSYSTWLTAQKKTLLTDIKKKQNTVKKKKNALNESYYIPLTDFVTYYNETAVNKLIVHSPYEVFRPKKGDNRVFTCRFPKNAELCLEFQYEDLISKLDPVFFAQYNISIPIGYIFDPAIRKAFPTISTFKLLDQEKEIAPDFSSCRLNNKLNDYEQAVFASAVELADKFFKEIQAPGCARGILDFFRGSAYQIAMISTNKTQFMQLFKEESEWIAQQHSKAEVVAALGTPDVIALNLADTMKKSRFPYFLKTSLAEIFKHLHPFEQQLLRAAPKKTIQKFWKDAVQLANDGLGQTEEPPFFPEDSFKDKEILDFLYAEIFQGRVVESEKSVDPISFFTDRFLPITNIGTEQVPVHAAVVELRRPEQGEQRYSDIKEMCRKYNDIHTATLLDIKDFIKKNVTELDVLHARWKKTGQFDLPAAANKAAANKAAANKAAADKAAADKAAADKAAADKAAADKAAANKAAADKAAVDKAAADKVTTMIAETVRTKEEAVAATKFAATLAAATATAAIAAVAAASHVAELAEAAKEAAEKALLAEASALTAVSTEVLLRMTPLGIKANTDKTILANAHAGLTKAVDVSNNAEEVRQSAVAARDAITATATKAKNSASVLEASTSERAAAAAPVLSLAVQPEPMTGPAAKSRDKPSIEPDNVKRRKRNTPLPTTIPSQEQSETATSLPPGLSFAVKVLQRKGFFANSSQSPEASTSIPRRELAKK